MLIIWGFKNYATTLAMLTLACRNGHTAAHRMVKTTRKFTLFFIPLFPVRHRWFTVCAQCGLQVEWQKEHAEEAATRAAAAGPGPGSMGRTDADPVAAPVDTGAYAGGTYSGDLAASLDPAGDGKPPSVSAGWYPCPSGQAGQERWWDGRGWTENVRQPDRS